MGIRGSARGFDVRRGPVFWHLSAQCDTARAVRTLAGLFREATHIKLRLVGIGGGNEDLPWLRAVNQAILLPAAREAAQSPELPPEEPGRTGAIVPGEAPGPAGWNKAILNVIG